MVLEFVKDGSLLSVLKKRRGRFTPQQFYFMCYSTVKGMKYLEREKVVHRDLACRNLLCSRSGSNWECKISDFGLSRELSYDVYSAKSKRAIPVRWTAPEIFSQGENTSKSDIWAWAVTCWEIYQCGLLPYGDLANDQVIEYVLSGKRLRVIALFVVLLSFFLNAFCFFFLQKPDQCPEEFYEIWEECWTENPKHRPSFQQIFKRMTKLGERLRYPEFLDDEPTDSESFSQAHQKSAQANNYSKNRKEQLIYEGPESEQGGGYEITSAKSKSEYDIQYAHTPSTTSSKPSKEMKNQTEVTSSYSLTPSDQKPKSSKKKKKARKVTSSSESENDDSSSSE